MGDFALKEDASCIAVEEDEQYDKVIDKGVAIPPPPSLQSPASGSFPCRATETNSSSAAFMGNVASSFEEWPTIPTELFDAQMSMMQNVASQSHKGNAEACHPSSSSTATAGIRQAFERPLTSMEDRVHADRLHASTDLCRETVGEDRRQARSAVRERLAAMRAQQANALKKYAVNRHVKYY